MEKTLGESRVRTEFNPSQDDVVSQIKQKTAELINLSNSLRDKNTGKDNFQETARLSSLAMTTYEEAAMWAVKAATA